MAGQARRPENIEKEVLVKKAIDAAAAFKRYLIGGDAKESAKFWKIYNSTYAGNRITEQTTFTDKLYAELEKVGKDPLVKPLLDAFKKDRGRLFGFMWRNPVHFTDFIKAVEKTRMRLFKGSAKDKDITRLRGVVKKLKGRKLTTRKSPVGRVRRVLRKKTGLSMATFWKIYNDKSHRKRREMIDALEDSVIEVLEQPAHRKAAMYYKNLTTELSKRRAKIQSRRCVRSLREFLLTGDGKRYNEFKKIIQTNPFSTDFKKALTSEFRAKITLDTGSGLAKVMTAYRAKSRTMNPLAFAAMVKDLYHKATKGKPAQVEALRKKYGPKVVDALLDIVAKGMAKTAIKYFRDVMRTGNAASEKAFMSLWNGNIATIIDGKVEMVPGKKNKPFWETFKSTYRRELGKNLGFKQLHRAFSQNILYIGIRDIATELAKPKPDMNRLHRDYGANLIKLVATNLSRSSWLARTPAELTKVIAAREKAGDKTAEAVRKMRVANKGKALSESYFTLAHISNERREIGTPLLVIFDKNFAKLSWMAGLDAAQIEAELLRRASKSPPDADATLARLVRGAVKDKTKLGQTLVDAYGKYDAAKKLRTALDRSHGKALTGYVEKNLQYLHWIVKPVEGIRTEMHKKRKNSFVISLHGTTGYSIDSLAFAIKDIYGNLGSQRVRLEKEYGIKLVTFVQKNRKHFSWAKGDVASVKQMLIKPSGRKSVVFKIKAGYLYRYSPAHLVPAIAKTRRGVARKGLPEMDVHDAYGKEFALPSVWKEVDKLPTISKSALDSRALVSQCIVLEKKLKGLYRHIKKYKILGPAVPILTEHIKRWIIANNKLALKAKMARGKDELEALNKEWKELQKSVITQTDIRNTLEMVFATIHLAQTGADLKRGSVTDPNMSDRMTIAALMRWYNKEKDTGKQPLIRDMVAAVMHKASPDLYKFINGMKKASYFSALGSVYNVIKNKKASQKTGAVGKYGSEFVDAVALQMGHLKLLESPSAGPKDLVLGKNALYAAIVIRCYNALDGPRPGEDRAAMVKLYGERFVKVVESNKDKLIVLKQANAGLAEIKTLPAPLKAKLYAAYVGAYLKSVGSLKRLYSKQDIYLVGAMSTVYRVLADKPLPDAPKAAKKDYKIRITRLRKRYGYIVTLVQRNWKDLGFLASINAKTLDLSTLSPSLLGQFRTAYEKSKAADLPMFMNNLVKIGQELPTIYLALRQALLYTNDVGSTSGTAGKNTIAWKFERALEKYEETFGKGNEYLLRQYINIDLLNKSFPMLKRRYGTSLPPGMKKIKTVRDLVKLLNSEQGRQLLIRGKKEYTKLKTNYQAYNTENNISVSTGEFSDVAVANFESQMSILDALYLGIALEKVNTSTSMGKIAMVGTMQSLIVINNRDPYLVGPFLLQVLPTLLLVAKDEKTLQMALTSFNSIFTTRYSDATRSLAYSDTMNRKYFLKVFALIAKRLPDMAKVFRHTDIADELRQTPSPTAGGGMGGTDNPLLYRVKPGFWHPSEAFKPLSSTLGGYTEQPRLTPDVSTAFPTGTVGALQFTVGSGAKGLHERMRLYVTPPGRKTFRPNVPSYLKINTIGSATLMRLLNKLFSSMPKVKDSYWLSYDVSASGYYGAEGGDVITHSGSFAASGAGKALYGGISGSMLYSGSRTETTTEGTDSTTVTTTRTDTATAAIKGGGLPIFRMFRGDFTYAGSQTETDVSGGPTPGKTKTNTASGKGTLETFADICKKRKVSMMLFVKGEHAPSTEGDSSVTKFQSRLYIIDQRGQRYEVSFGKDTERALSNFVYGGMHRDKVMASLRFLGNKIFNKDATDRGFDGAAIGFTIPRGGAGDTFSALAIGNIIRSLGDPDKAVALAAQQALGMAVTSLLKSRKHRDVYAAFYRGTETITTDPDNPSKITGAKVSSGIGEVMWRRISMSPGGYQFEIRAAGGYPATAGIKVKYEWTKGKTKKGLGVTVAYSTVRLLQEFRQLNLQASELYATTRNMLISTYGWSKNEARDMGYVVALNYMYSKLEDYSVLNPDGTYSTDPSKAKNQHYASALLMYWAKRHGVLLGVQKAPGWTNIYTKIHTAMTQIQANPENEATVLANLATELNTAFSNNIWNFTLGYGYDGQRTGVYTFGGGRFTDAKDEQAKQAYASLKSIFVFGRPAKAWLEVGGYGYTYPSKMVVEDTTTTSGFTILDKNPVYLDLTAGIGSTKWPATGSHLYQRSMKLSARPSLFSALHDTYTTLGGGDKKRLVSAYGQKFVTMVEGGLKSLDWMVKPPAEIRKEMLRRMKKDIIVRTFLIGVPGRKLGAKTVSLDEAKMLREIYLGLRTPGGLAKLRRKYKPDIITYMARHSASLAWVLLPENRVKGEIRKRAAVKGSLAQKLTRFRLPEPKGNLTGREAQRLFRQNMVDMIFACNTQMKTKIGIRPHLYSVELARHLKAAKGKDRKPARYTTFYVLNTTRGASPGKTGALIIGNSKDAREWINKGKILGSDIMRVKITRAGDKYKMDLSGDKRLRWLTAWKVFGGVTVPLDPKDHKYHDMKGNFTIGGIVKIVENHKGELLAGALYGRRQFGNERWENWTVTFSGMLKKQSNKMVDEKWYGYVFFNRLTKKMMFIKDKNNSAEMREVCLTLSDGACDNFNELRRTTGGIGFTWSKVNINTGKTKQLDFFFEAGSQTWSPFNTTAHGRKRTEPIFRAGIGYGFKVTRDITAGASEFYIGLLGWKGFWNYGTGLGQPGIHAPQYMPMIPQYLQAVRGKMNAWGFGVTLTWKKDISSLLQLR